MTEKNKTLLSLSGQLPLFFTNAVFALWFTPFLLGKLGKEAYAFVPLSAELINLATVIMVILTSMLSVYADEGIRENNINEINEFFSSSLYSNIITGVISLIPLLAISFYIDRIFSVPEEYTTGVKLLFIMASLSFCLSQIKSSFLAINVGTEHRYINGYLRTGEKAAAIIIAVILLEAFRPSVAYEGAAILSGTALSLAAAVIISKKLIPGLKISYGNVKKSRVKNIFFTGFWNSLAQIIILISLNIGAPLANILYGAYMQSEYSLAAIIPFQLRNLLIFGLNYLIPFFSYPFGEAGDEAMKETLKGIMRTISYIMGALCALLCGLGDSFLKLWIGNNYTPLIYNIMVIYSIGFMITGIFSVLFGILVVQNKVRTPTILISIAGILNIPLSILFSNVWNIGKYGVALASLITCAVQYFFILPGYFCEATKTQKKDIYRPFFGGAGIALVGTAASIVLKSFFEAESYLKLGASIIIIILVCTAVAARRLISYKEFTLTLKILRKDYDELQGKNYDTLV